jgi:hypothetical protein
MELNEEIAEVLFRGVIERPKPFMSNEHFTVEQEDLSSRQISRMATEGRWVEDQWGNLWQMAAHKHRT